MRLVLLALLLIPSICFGGWSVKHYQVVAGSSPSALFLSDAFNAETNGMDLVNHIPETGGTWIVSTGVPNVWDTGVVSNASDTGVHYNNVSPPDADYEVSIKAKILSTASNKYAGAVVRATNDHGGYAMYVSGTGACSLSVRTTDGAWSSTLDSDSVSGYDMNTEYTMSISAVGTTLSGTVLEGAVELCALSATDNTYAATGNAGVLLSISSEVTEVTANDI